MSRARRQQYMLRTEASEQEASDHNLQIHGESLSRTETIASLPKRWEA